MGNILGLVVEQQFARIVTALGVPAGPARWLFDNLVRETLVQYDRRGGFSGINRNGVPFQWSVSVAPRTGGLRFVTDGQLHLPVARRMQLSRHQLARMAGDLTRKAPDQLDVALRYMLPGEDALELTGSVMGIWTGATLTPDGQISLKAYVNQEVGTAAAAYQRMGDSLQAADSLGGLDRLTRLVSLAGGDIIPAFSAVEIRSDGARQIKLYLHGGKDPGRLMGRLARGLDCAGAAGALDLFRYELLGHSPWPENGVFLSLHLENDTECRLKVDLDTCLTGASNAEIDRRIRRAIRTFGLADAEYSVVKDALTGNQTASRATIAAASCTAGGRDVAVNVYFQPASRGADRIRSR